VTPVADGFSGLRSKTGRFKKGFSPQDAFGAIFIRRIAGLRKTADDPVGRRARMWRKDEKPNR
jgi:hypothetical protein